MVELKTIHVAGIGLPIELYDAAKEGSLVLFVGAGISIDSGIPEFEELADKVIGNTINDDKLHPSERLNKVQHSGVDVNREVSRIISDKKPVPSRPHEIIMKFFNEKEMRIVTTNFDTLLTQYAESNNIKHESYHQPALPLGDNFTGVVYLHGAIDKPTSPLIVTERDFAQAYIRYGRQSAFIREMFAKFTVLFIGYSYEDKMLQLITKANIDNNGISRTYALVENTSYVGDPLKWALLNIKAIPYSGKNGKHDALWDMLEEWGDINNRDAQSHQSAIENIIQNAGGN